MCHNDQPRKIVPILYFLIAVSVLQFTVTEDCTIPECFDEAERLMDSMNSDVNPCDDFVEFACGKQFDKFDSMKTELDPDLLGPTTYRLHLWWVRRVLQQRLDEPDHIDDARVLKLAKIFWHSCKSVTSEDALMSVRILLNRLGGWPLITESWKEEDFSWDKFSRCARRLGFLPRMFIFVGLNVDNVRKSWHPNDTMSLTIEKPKYIDTSTILTDPVHDIGYYTIAEYISGNGKILISEIDASLNLARQLDELDCAPKEQRSETMSIKQLQEKFPIIDWFKHIKAMLRPRQAKYLTDYNCIIVDVCYLSAFAKFIPRIEKKIQANYAFMAIINDLFGIIRPQLVLAFATDQETIAQICFDTTAVVFKEAMDSIIGRKLDSPLISKLEEFEGQVYNQTLRIFETIPWMDEETSFVARRKLSSITFQSPFPDDIFNNQYFYRLNFKSEDSLAIIFREMNVFLVDNYYLQAGRTKIRYGVYWRDKQAMRAVFQNSVSPNVATVKPDIFNNKIYMPAGAILHKQFSVRRELDFINYGSVGIQLGESLSHLIYQKGAHVDAEGEWHMQSWWTETTQKQFMRRESCLAIGDVEPIADASMIFGLIGGVEIAYMAMFHDCSTTTCTTTLEGLDYDTRQLFWITFIASDCDRDLKHRYNTVLSHNENFANDFQCGFRSRMYISDKCKMWTL